MTATADRARLVDPEEARASTLVDQRLEIELAFRRSALPDVDMLELVVLGEAPLSEFATDAALLVTAEREPQVDHVVVVHPHGTGLDATSQRHRAFRILRPHGAAEPVDRVVGKPDRF